LQADEQQAPDHCCRKKRRDLSGGMAFGSLGFAREDAEEFVPWTPAKKTSLLQQDRR
jgi:hypothetical protein